MAFYKVLFDARFAACRAFADEAQRLGLNVHEIRGDVTRVWFHDLHARWKKGPAAIAGLTQKAALFCLDVLARDQRMPLMFLGEHFIRSVTLTDHVLTGLPDVQLQAAALGDGGPDWPRYLARLMGRFPCQSPQAKARPVTAPLVRAGDDPDHLVSWVIAPRSTA